MDMTMKKIQVTLKKSVIGSTKSQRATVSGLGLRKINHTRVLNNTPAIRGMVKKVIHLLHVEEVEQ
jgi:large subunit ribosomal protein L30